MKKLFIMLMCVILLGFALAEEPQPTFEPIPIDTIIDQLDLYTQETSTDSISLDVRGNRVELVFDDSPQYSSISDGAVQASYYAYSDDGNTLYELFLYFPDTVQPGDVITPLNAVSGDIESSIVLIVSDMQTRSEDYYFSSSIAGSAYPEGSDFSIRIDSTATAQGTISYSGAITATLVALNLSNGDALASVNIPETSFSFTVSGASQERHLSPLPSFEPGDMRKV